ncbi:MAG: hydrogenase expression/formation protein HypE [Gammaproteobacteria bacterium]|nr:MAG: hydrogenase expression/formation protein HypE [Gammaproteobacteria bacterium]
MGELVRELFLEVFDDPELRRLDDLARLEPAAGGRLGFTTDCHVITPPIFPGGDIGRLAVCGTVNDLAVGGAEPQALSCGFVLEEGLELALLERIVRSMKAAAREAGVRIVAGDTKVVRRGEADRIYITTAGVGWIAAGTALGPERIRPGDRLLVSGPVGDHGAAVLDARGELSMEVGLDSDCRPLASLARALLAACGPGLRAMRDPTRGGLTAVLNEFARHCGCRLEVEEEAVPVREAVRGVCELLGLDPFDLPCEGVLLAVVDPAQAGQALEVLRSHPDGAHAQLIGEAGRAGEPEVVVRTPYGGQRLLDQPLGDPLPRIC